MFSQYIPILVLVIAIILLQFSYHAKKIVRTVAGVPPYGGDGKLAVNAFLFGPSSIYLSPNNELYIADTYNHIIRKVDKYGIISTIAGIPGVHGYSGDNGYATEALLFEPQGISVSPNNEIIIADTSNKAIRKISQGNITTIATAYFPECVFVAENGEILFCNSQGFVIQKIFLNGTIGWNSISIWL